MRLSTREYKKYVPFKRILRQGVPVSFLESFKVGGRVQRAEVGPFFSLKKKKKRGNPFLPRQLFGIVPFLSPSPPVLTCSRLKTA